MSGWALIMVCNWKKLGLSIFTWGVGFLFFAFAYCLPLVLDAPGVMIEEPRVRLLFDQALSVPAVWFELLRYFSVQAGLLFIIYGFLSVIGWRFAAICKLKSWMGQFIFLTLGWLLMLAGNAWLFPFSNYSFAFQAVARPEWVPALAGVLCGAAFLVMWRTSLRLFSFFNFKVLGVVALGVGLLGAVWSLGRDESVSDGRNIVIIGVDSLSAATFAEMRGMLPALDGLLAQGVEFKRAYTPIGRTFPAWVSILTGQTPAEHGAVFNLRRLDKVRRDHLLPFALRDQGYHTVFALDERRFANIDESFGFDRVVGPGLGVLDFVLQGVNDTPLTNLLLQTPWGRYLLPYSYINVASHTNYSANAFVDRVLQAAETEIPLFLAVHFESAHFPYKTRHARAVVNNENTFMSAHVEALTVVDAQVGRLMHRLRASGVLNDALVIVLSDHGEGVGELETRIVRDGTPFDIRSFGHGADLLSDHQNRIVLGGLRYRLGQVVEAAGVSNEQVSLLDVRDAIEGYARYGVFELRAKDSCLVVETGLRLSATEDYRTLKKLDVAAQAAAFYEVDELGRLRLREESLSSLLVSKDIGLRCPDRLTWYAPSGKRYWAYQLDRGGMPTLQVEPRLDDVARIEAYRTLYVGAEVQD